MTVFGVLRGFTFLARDVFEAALYLIPAPGLSGYDVDGADVLAEREAAVDVAEPMTREEALGPYHAFGWMENYSEWPDSESALLMEPPLTADELVAVRQLIEERFGEPHAPVASASPPTPADATGQQEKCGAPRLYGGDGCCDKPADHKGRHQYRGIYWTNSTNQ